MRLRSFSRSGESAWTSEKYVVLLPPPFSRRSMIDAIDLLGRTRALMRSAMTATSNGGTRIVL